jgi:hypothetical protein
MAKGSGAKYANGNYKNQQQAYNKTEKGRRLIKGAQMLRAKLNLKPGDPRDAAHYAGSATEGRPQSKHINRKSRLKVRHT